MVSVASALNIITSSDHADAHYNLVFVWNLEVEFEFYLSLKDHYFCGHFLTVPVYGPHITRVCEMEEGALPKWEGELC